MSDNELIAAIMDINFDFNFWRKKMNKQEVIDLIKKEARHHCGERECYRQGCVKFVELDKAVDFVSRIGEQPKVVIPKFVADWIEYVKKDRMVGSITYALYHSTFDYPNMDAIELWREPWENQEMVARAWLDGYTIEQENLYTVEIPNPNWKHSKGWVTGLVKTDDGIVICQTNNPSQLTESEIRKDFDWAWNEEFAKEVER